MADVLAQKSQEVLDGLLDSLSNKNKKDLERAMNANTVLQDFCDNEHCFGMLTNARNLKRIIMLCCQGESNDQNLPYAL